MHGPCAKCPFPLCPPGGETVPQAPICMDGNAENRYPSCLFIAATGSGQLPYAAVAQWIEYWPPKPRVVGSIPASRTNRIKDLGHFCSPIIFAGLHMGYISLSDSLVGRLCPTRK
jgi:hypothetical protein